MQNRLSRLINLAAVVMLASGCSGDNTTVPLPIDGSANVPLSSAITFDIATTAGNAIASDIESLIANEMSALRSFARPDHLESCIFNAAGLIYSCTTSGDGKSVMKSYQFLDASGNPMEKFVKGTTEAIHYLVKTDGVESGDNNTSVSHSLRDATVSGFHVPISSAITAASCTSTPTKVDRCK